MMKMSTTTAEHYSWGDRCDGWHFVKQPSLSVIRERMLPATSEVNHFHHRARQFFFVLAGVAVVEVDGVAVELHPGEGLEIAPGVPHQMNNRSAEDLEFLVVSQPPSHGDRQVVELGG
jgi:mannose-6-phosphate isomerase-like protein (cupin superfamily)